MFLLGRRRILLFVIAVIYVSLFRIFWENAGAENSIIVKVEPHRHIKNKITIPTKVIAVYFHSEDVWGKKRAQLPKSISLKGQQYNVIQLTSLEQELVEFHYIVLWNALLIPTTGTTSFLKQLLISVSSNAKLASCTVIDGDKVVNSGFSSLHPTHSDEFFVVPRLSGEGLGHRQLIDSNFKSSVSLLNSDCLLLSNKNNEAGSLLNKLLKIMPTVTNVTTLKRQLEVSKTYASYRAHRNVILSMKIHTDTVQTPVSFSRDLLSSITVLGIALKKINTLSKCVDVASWDFERYIDSGTATDSHFGMAAQSLRQGDFINASVLLQQSTETLLEDVKDLDTRLPSPINVPDWRQLGWTLTALLSTRDEAIVPGNTSGSLDWRLIPGKKKNTQFDAKYLWFLNDQSLTNSDLSNSHRVLFEPRPEFIISTIGQRRLVVAWLLPCCSCCGFVNEAVDLIRGLLLLGVDVRISSKTKGCMCDSLPQHTQSLMNSLHTNGTMLMNLAIKPQTRVILIQHGIPNIFLEMRAAAGITDTTGMRVVSRSMYEFSKLPANFSSNLNKYSDEVWVPCNFVKDVMISENVTVFIAVLPESISTDVFHSLPGQPLIELPPLSYENRLEEFGQRPQNKPFSFLSMFKWEPRKGWDVLIESYIKAFSKNSNTALYISTIPHRMPDAERSEIVNDVVKLLKSLGYNREDVPYICIIYAEIKSSEIPALYAATDAFVLPTRGEGWGLPIMQALAMGKPTIATAWSGHMHFLTLNNSLLLNYSEEEIPRKSYYGWSPGKKWAEPNISELKRLMILLASDKELCSKLGKQAAIDVCVLSFLFSTRVSENNS